jgi:hypothetical protein
VVGAAPRLQAVGGAGSLEAARAIFGAIAQLEEHLLCKQGAGGSSPPSSTRSEGMSISVKIIKRLLLGAVGSLTCPGGTCPGGTSRMRRGARVRAFSRQSTPHSDAAVRIC